MNVLVTDRMPRFPEVCGIGVIGSCHEQPPGRLETARIGRIKPFEVIHIFKIESQHSELAMHLETVPIAAPGVVSRGLQTTCAAILKPDECPSRIIHIAAFVKGFRHSGHFPDGAVQP